MYLRKRVQPVTVKPEPGTYKGCVRLFFETPTNGAEIMYTLDGTLPEPNSPSDRGSRCLIYFPIQGIPLRSAGRHCIKVIARKEGMIPSKPQKFVYKLTGIPVRTPQPRLVDTILERRFLNMSELDPPMPIRLARARSPDLFCALVDTCPKETIRKEHNKGRELALFQLTHIPGTVCRSDTYHRIYPPKMNLKVPQLPTRLPEQTPLPSLRSTHSRALSPSTYDRPDFTQTLGNSQSRRRCASQNAMYDFRPPPSAIPDMSATQLFWFENRTALNTVDNEDNEERDNDNAYLKQCNAMLTAETQRKAAKSPIFTKQFTSTIPITGDVAAANKQLLQLLLLGKDFCHSRMKTLLCMVPFTTLLKEWHGSQSISTLDIVSVSQNSLSPGEVTKTLQSIAQPPARDPTFPADTLLLLCKYVIWVANSIPEAPIGLVVAYWKNESKDNRPEPGCGRIELISMIDAYRRTRGASPSAIASLYEAFYEDIAWGNDGFVPSSTVLRVFSSIPTVDAALMIMGDPTHAMYSRPLDVWGEL